MSIKSEISIIDLIKTCWRSKTTFLLAAICTVSAGSLYHLQFNETYYASYIRFDVLPSAEKFNPGVLANIEHAFDNQENFQAWSSEKANKSVEFNEIVGQVTIDGKQFALNKSERLASFAEDGLLSIKTNDIKAIDDIHTYFFFISTLVSEQMQNTIQNLINETSEFPANSNTKPTVFEYSDLLLLEKQIRDNGLIQLRPPTLPIQTSLGWRYVIVVSSFMGLLLGFVIVLIRTLK